MVVHSILNRTKFGGRQMDEQDKNNVSPSEYQKRSVYS